MSQGRHAGPIISQINDVQVIECEICKISHVWPFPSEESYKAAYEQEYYSTVWPQYFSRFEEDLEWWNLSYSERYSFFEKEVSTRHRRLLDVGSGPGYFLLHGKNRGWDVTGIEPSKQASEYSIKMGLNIRREFLTRDTKALGTYDVVHMSEVLEQLLSRLTHQS